MAGEFSYQDFDLLIEPGAPGSYRARVLRSPAGEAAPVPFTVPFSPVELENFVLKVSRGRRRARGAGRPESAPLKEFGGKLYQAVFQHELHDILQRSLSLTRAQGVGMRLRLRLGDTPELAELPWEFLYDPRHDRFLAQSRHSPLVRYLDLPDPPQPLTVAGPLRLLVMISSPSDYPELDAEQEWNLLTGALAGPQAEGRVVIERLPANMKDLRQRLRREQFHIFHFVGHGRYRPDWGSGVLVMEDRHGRSHEVSGDELGGLLNEYEQTRLAVLNACEGARSDDTGDPFAGMAQSLIRQGLPAVVAMQFEITDDAAIIFAQELYGAIADGFPLEAALAEARGAIRDEGNLTEWGTPVLYSRAPDGRLFDVTRQAPGGAEPQASEQADRQAQEDAGRQAREEAERQAREEAEQRANEEAQRQAQAEADRQASGLASHYAGACAAADAGHWDQALTAFTMITDIDPGYRDVQERAENARKQQQIARWQAEVRRLHEAAQWAAVVRAGEELHALDPAAADPDGLVTSARAKLANLAQTEQLEADYQAAQRLLENGDWQHAVKALERVAQVNPAYRATPALLDRARRQHAASTRPPEQTRAAHGNRYRSTPGAARPMSEPKTLAATLPIQSYGYCVTFGPGSGAFPAGLLASGDQYGQITLWDYANGQKFRTIDVDSFPFGDLDDSKELGKKLLKIASIHSLAFSPDGEILASPGKDHTIQLWNPVTGQQLRALAGHTQDVDSLAFSPDGHVLASGSTDQTVRLWDPLTGRQLRSLRGHAAAFSPDGQALASVSQKAIQLWNPATGHYMASLTGHTHLVTSVAFSPDGRILASAAGDGTMQLWNPATSQQLRTLTGHAGDVNSVAFRPDGRMLASAGFDKTVRLWDPATGQHLRTLTGHTHNARSVAFSADGQVLASTGHDQTVRLWR
jgi:tetratricopeptide (TPR) repeat protein